MLRRLLNDKRERVEFADLVTKYDRRGKVRLRYVMFRISGVRVLHNQSFIDSVSTCIFQNYFTPTSSIHRYETRRNRLFNPCEH